MHPFVQGWLSYKKHPKTVFMEDDEYYAAMQIEKDYYEHEWPKVQKAVQEMIKDVPRSEREEMRRRYLLERIREIKPLALASCSPELHRELSRLLFEAKVHLGKMEGINDEDIIRARQFPITRLIQNKNGMAICPFHKEKTPSLNLRKNFYFCHGCGETGDIIDFVMKKDSITFRQAIMKLHF